jgi:hypothetical protein
LDNGPPPGMTPQREHIIQRAYDVFRADFAATPSITLRGGWALSFYDAPPPYDPDLDVPTDAYLEQCGFGGVGFLDAPSWRHYLPRLIDYSLRNLASHEAGTMAIEAFLWSLRPPDRDPPRLGSLNKEQEAVIVAALDELAFADDSVYREFAQQVMEEWWIPNALYRPEPPPQ